MTFFVQDDKTIGKAAMMPGRLFWHGRNMGMKGGIPLIRGENHKGTKTRRHEEEKHKAFFASSKSFESSWQGVVWATWIMTFSHAFILIPQGEAAYALSGLH